jgi:hypothetical protein
MSNTFLHLLRSSVVLGRMCRKGGNDTVLLPPLAHLHRQILTGVIRFLRQMDLHLNLHMTRTLSNQIPVITCLNVSLVKIVMW